MHAAYYWRGYFFEIIHFKIKRVIGVTYLPLYQLNISLVLGAKVDGASLARFLRELPDMPVSGIARQKSLTYKVNVGALFTHSL